MVVGEPDEKNGVLHGLNSMFYPDHQPLVSGNEELIRAYYRHDAMWLGFTHGKNVYNTRIDAKASDCITRTYAAPEHRALVVQLFHAGPDGRWSVPSPMPKTLQNLKVEVPVPGGPRPKNILYSSPDHPQLANPSPVPFEMKDGVCVISVPELRVHGTLVIEY